VALRDCNLKRGGDYNARGESPACAQSMREICHRIDAKLTMESTPVDAQAMQIHRRIDAKLARKLCKIYFALPY